MIGLGTTLKVFDNSGGKVVECIRALKGNHNTKATLGDTIVVSVKKAINTGTGKDKKRKVLKKQVHYGLVVACKKELSRFDGTYISFNVNSVIIVDKQSMPLGTRIFTPIPKEITKKKYSKIFSLAPYIV